MSWYIHVIPRVETKGNRDFPDNLGYTVKPCLKKKQKQKHPNSCRQDRRFCVGLERLGRGRQAKEAETSRGEKLPQHRPAVTDPQKPSTVLRLFLTVSKTESCTHHVTVLCT